MIGEYGSYEPGHGLVVLPDGSGVTAMLSPSGNGIWDNCTLSGEVVVAAESIRDEFETWNFEANLTYDRRFNGMSMKASTSRFGAAMWRGTVAFVASVGILVRTAWFNEFFADDGNPVVPFAILRRRNADSARRRSTVAGMVEAGDDSGWRGVGRDHHSLRNDTQRRWPLCASHRNGFDRHHDRRPRRHDQNSSRGVELAR